MLISAFSPISTIENFFKYNGDKRVAELRFMDSPWEVIMISSFYVYFCYDLGPHRLMKNREAFDLVWTVRTFNSLILLLNVWLLIRFFSLLNWGYDSIGCAVSITVTLNILNDTNIIKQVVAVENTCFVQVSGFSIHCESFFFLPDAKQSTI